MPDGGNLAVFWENFYRSWEYRKGKDGKKKEDGNR